MELRESNLMFNGAKLQLILKLLDRRVSFSFQVSFELFGISSEELFYQGPRKVSENGEYHCVSSECQ